MKTLADTAIYSAPSVYSSNSGVCPGSDQPAGLVILAMLIRDACEFTRPKNSSMIFGADRPRELRLVLK